MRFIMPLVSPAKPSFTVVGYLTIIVLAVPVHSSTTNVQSTVEYELTISRSKSCKHVNHKLSDFQSFWQHNLYLRQVCYENI